MVSLLSTKSADADDIASEDLHDAIGIVLLTGTLDDGHQRTVVDAPDQIVIVDVIVTLEDG